MTITWTIIAPIAGCALAIRWIVPSFRRWRRGDLDVVDLLRDVGVAGFVFSVSLGTMLHPIAAAFFLGAVGYGEIGEAAKKFLPRTGRDRLPAADSTDDSG